MTWGAAAGYDGGPCAGRWRGACCGMTVHTDAAPAGRGRGPMRDEAIDAVLRAVAAWVPQFDDQPSVGQVADRTGDPFLVLVATLISLRTREEVTRAVMWRLFDLARTP